MKRNNLCLRCKNKEAVFTCLMCDSFKFLCTQCDNYVHGLPSKKKHKRNAILAEKEEILIQIKQPNEEVNKYIPEVKESYRSVDWDYKFNIGSSAQVNMNSNNFTNDKNAKDKDINIIDKSLNTLYFSQPLQGAKSNDKGSLSPLKSNFSSIKEEDLQTCNNNYQNFIGQCDLSSNKQLYSFNNYSREYMNEIKNIFEQEKTELQYKNSSLQNNLDRLKSSFGEQIGNLNTDLEDIQKRHSVHLKSIQNTYENRISCLIKDKDAYITQLLTRVDELDKINQELTFKLEDNITNVHNIKETCNERLNDLEKDLHTKEEEEVTIKANYEIKIADIENSHEEKINNIVLDFETRIRGLIDQFEQGREKMTKMLQEREKDIIDLVERNKEEIGEYEKMNQNLTNEINCHKQNILSIRNKRNEYENEIENLKEYVDELRKETKFQLSEIKMLDNQNKIIIKENEELKIQVSKLDKLVYGKIRAPTFKNNNN